MKAKRAIEDAAKRLSVAGVENPRREVSILLERFSPKLRLAGGESYVLSESNLSQFSAMIERRARHEPVSHILGKRAFWNHDFRVTSDVLDPRPDTETLIEAALQVPFETVLDMGTGSGCILISLLDERPDAHGLGIDISPKSLEVARGNGTSIGVDARCDWAVSDWFDQVRGRFDLIVSNPPYIDAAIYEGLERGVREFEPKIALTPGADGLEPYRVLAAQGQEYLTDQGWMIVEIGFDQGASVCEVFEKAGWCCVEMILDLNGKPRVVKAQVGQK